MAPRRRKQGRFDDLDPATVAVRELIAGSRELVGRVAAQMDMNPTDMSAIGALMLNGPMGVVQLAEHLSIRSASATVMVDRLERAGHVQRVRDDVDRRRVGVAATAVAREVATAAWGPIVDRIDEVARALSDDERAVVCGFLARVSTVNDEAGREVRP